MDINPDLQLEHGERAHLAQLMAMEGYKVLHRLMRSEVDKFLIAMINADPANPKEVLSRQVLAKAAAQFFEAITKRVNEEVYLYVHTPRPGDEPVDPTADLELDNLAAALDDVPNILGGEIE